MHEVRPHFGYLSSVTAKASPSSKRPALKEGVHTGDAFDLAARVPDGSVDLLLTSPPYWGLRSYGLTHDSAVLQTWMDAGCSPSRVPPYDWYRSESGVLGLEPYPSWYVAHLAEFFSRIKRILRPDGSMWINLGDTYFARWSSLRDGGRQGIGGTRSRRRTPSGGYLHDKQLLLIPARFAIAMQEEGWILRNDLIWAKPFPIPRPEVDRLRLSHEHWFHFVQRRSNGRPAYYYDLDNAEEGALDVVTYPTSSGANGHSATFPSELVRRRIETSSRRGGLVFDPFCGTGTTLVEAKRARRRGLGFDLSPNFVRTAKASLKRIEATKKR